MADYVYIIQSEQDGSYYKGYTQDPIERLAHHNAGHSTYTSTKVPWRLRHVEALPSRREALIREKAVKKYSHAQIERLVMSPKNIVTDFQT